MRGNSDIIWLYYQERFHTRGKDFCGLRRKKDFMSQRGVFSKGISNWENSYTKMHSFRAEWPVGWCGLQGEEKLESKLLSDHTIKQYTEFELHYQGTKPADFFLTEHKKSNFNKKTSSFILIHKYWDFVLIVLSTGKL